MEIRTLIPIRYGYPIGLYPYSTVAKPYAELYGRIDNRSVKPYNILIHELST
jgi:hypothetical protein